MKIRSLPLFQYLKENNVLNGTEEDIAKAKKAYRKEYKKKWKAKINNSELYKEIRPSFTLKEHTQICIRAKLYGLNPTSYVKQLVLSNQEETDLIPNKDNLLSVLQSISMSLLKTPEDTEAYQLILKAEILLLQYLNTKS